MRDPNRIKPLLKTIERVWKLFPDLRLSQLIENAAHAGGWHNPDLFYLEDNKLLEYLVKFEKEIKDD